MEYSHKSRISWTGIVYAALSIFLSIYFTAERTTSTPGLELRVQESVRTMKAVGLLDIEPPVAGAKNVSNVLQKRITAIQEDFETVLSIPSSDWIALKTVKSINLTIELKEAKPPYVLSSIFIKADPKVAFSFFTWNKFNDTLLATDPVFESSQLIHKISRQQQVIRKVMTSKYPSLTIVLSFIISFYRRLPNDFCFFQNANFTWVSLSSNKRNK